MRKSFLVILALLVLLIGTLSAVASAVSYNDEATESSVSLQDAKPVQKQPLSIGQVLWLIVTVPPILIALGIGIAVRVKQRQLWFAYLREKLGDGTEDEEI